MSTWRARRPAAISTATWLALLAVPALLFLKIGFPFPNNTGTQSSSRWLGTSSAPGGDALAAGAGVAWCIAVVVQIRKHRMSVRGAALVEANDAALTTDAVLIPTPLDRLTENASRCLTLVLEAPVQIDGPGARGLLSLVCAEWLRRNSSAGILLDNSLEGDLKVIGPGARPAFTFAGEDRLLRLVEGEVLGRRRHALEMDLAEMAASDEPAPLLVIVADVAPSLQERWQALADESAALSIGVLSVGTDLTAPQSLTVTELLPPMFTPLAELRESPTLAPVDGVAPPAEADFRPARTSTPLASVQATIPVVQVHAPVVDERPIRVQVLGPYRIWAHGEEISTGLRSASRELLAWYLLQEEGGSASAAVDALWPDTDPEQISKRFWRALGDLRSRLRSPDGSSSVALLTKSAGIYRPSEVEIACDLWHFRRSLFEARRSDDSAVVRDQLRKALDCYRGDLFTEADYPWAVGAATSIRRQVHDVALRLSKLEREAGRIENAIAVIERAITVEPYDEDLARTLITLRLAMDQPARAVEVFDQRTVRLREIGATPSSVTRTLLKSTVPAQN